MIRSPCKPSTPKSVASNRPWMSAGVGSRGSVPSVMGFQWLVVNWSNGLWNTYIYILKHMGYKSWGYKKPLILIFYELPGKNIQVFFKQQNMLFQYEKHVEHPKNWLVWSLYRCFYSVLSGGMFRFRPFVFGGVNKNTLWTQDVLEMDETWKNKQFEHHGSQNQHLWQMWQICNMFLNFQFMASQPTPPNLPLSGIRVD